MTPLAHALAADASKPASERRYGDIWQLLGLFNDLHFFECTAIHQAAIELRHKITSSGGVSRLAFLPAPRTWIELETPASPQSKRCAYLLEEDGDCAVVSMVFLDRDGSVSLTKRLLKLPLCESAELGKSYTLLTSGWSNDESIDRDAADEAARILYALLAMINTPKVIGRRQHMPHRGLEKRLIQAMPVLGKFPLRAWKELVLEVSPPVAAGRKAHEAHLTGERALHFVRKHLRLSWGQLVWVEAHWRGNGELGIAQTRYRLKMGDKRRRRAA